MYESLDENFWQAIKDWNYGKNEKVMVTTSYQ